MVAGCEGGLSAQSGSGSARPSAAGAAGSGGAQGAAGAAAGSTNGGAEEEPAAGGDAEAAEPAEQLTSQHQAGNLEEEEPGGARSSIPRLHQHVIASGLIHEPKFLLWSEFLLTTPAPFK